ncbi:ABC transporter substrate-binding protein [Pontibacterium sp.]|uniref:ABC transporter substrate-binding protein n=1 Tax=Pontibacterium sp. TaxID=2036026 RepID=UPI00356495CE
MRHLPSIFDRARFVRRCLHCVAFLYLCSIQQASAALTPVTVQLKWSHQFQFAGYYMAKELGLYEKAGLDVTLKPASPGLSVVNEVTSGQADFGVGTSDLIYYRAQGKPVVVLGVIFQHSPQALISRYQSTPATLQDISTQSLMLEPNAADLWALFRDEGLNIEKLNTEKHEFSVQPFIDDQIHSMSIYTTDEPFLLNQQGVKYQIFHPRSRGIDFYGDNFFTTDTLINDKPELVKAFRKATLEGWDYALQHVEQTINVIQTHYNAQHSREHLRFEAQEMSKLIRPDLVEIGYMNSGRWQHIADTFLRSGILSKKPDLNALLFQTRRPETPFYRTTAFIVYSLLTLTLLAFALYLMLGRRNLKAEIERRKAAESDLAHSLDQLVATREEKQTFLDMISHEYRTPLAIIQNSCSILEQQIDGTIANSQAKFNAIEKAIKRLVALIETIPGKKRRFEHDDNVSGLFYGLQDSVNAARIIYKNPFDVHRCVDDEIYINTPPEILATCLDNIISNAAKYSDGAAVTINTTLDERNIYVSVADHGKGIAPEEQSHIFERYYRGKNTDPKQSMGLGLYLVKLYTESAGGTVSLESTVAVGTKVTLSFPYFNDENL